MTQGNCGAKAREVERRQMWVGWGKRKRKKSPVAVCGEILPLAQVKVDVLDEFFEFRDVLSKCRDVGLHEEVGVAHLKLGQCLRAQRMIQARPSRQALNVTGSSKARKGY